MRAFRNFVRGGKKKEEPAKGKGEEAEAKNSDDEALKDAFNKFDVNGDGVIDKEELSALLINFLDLKKPPSDAQIGRIMAKVDLNNDGTISFDEFSIMMASRNQTKNEFLTTFKNFDKDGDGYITSDELAECMRKVHKEITDEEIDSIMKSLDQNGDGKISFQEFLDYFVG